MTSQTWGSYGPARSHARRSSSGSAAVSRWARKRWRNSGALRGFSTTGKRSSRATASRSASESGVTVAGTGKPCSRATACWCSLSMIASTSGQGVQGRRKRASTSAWRGPSAAIASSWVA